MTREDAFAALARFQAVCERQNLQGNEGPLDALGAAVVLALKRNDFAAVVEAIGKMIQAAEAMPPGSHVWRKPQDGKQGPNRTSWEREEE